MYKGALIYFEFWALFLFICGFCQFILKKNEFIVFYLWNNPGFKPKVEELSPLLPRSGGMRLSPKAQPVMKKETLKGVCATLKEILATTQGLLYSIMIVFATTLFLFPGTTSDTYFNFIRNMHLANEEGWY